MSMWRQVQLFIQGAILSLRCEFAITNFRDPTLSYLLHARAKTGQCSVAFSIAHSGGNNQFLSVGKAGYSRARLGMLICPS